MRSALGDAMRRSNDETYAQMPYEGCAHRDTHPSHVWAVAALMGLDPGPPAGSRVLELGCGRGGNLVPMAASLPGARFVGVDLSAGQIERAKASRDALGLDNLDLRVGDIASLDASLGDGSLGEFDYIIAHGVYSWIPAAARDRLLALCGALLAPDGVAYVSHNILPGWHQKQALRQMMLYHLRSVEGAAAQVEAARGFLDFVAGASSPSDPAYKLWLSEEQALLARSPTDYVFHEHLAAHNAPSYFHAFMAAAASHGLQFVADAWLPANFGRLLPAALAADLVAMVGGDRIAFEQYQDFVLNRSFRKTLLCRRERALVSDPAPGRWADGHLMSSWVRVAGRERAWQRGRDVLGDVDVRTDALLAVLADVWPATRSVQAVAAVLDRSGDAIGSFCDDLFLLAMNGVVEVMAVPVSVGDGALPRVHGWVRQEIAEGVGRLTTAHHQTATLDGPLRVLARLADGTRDREALVGGLVAAVEAGELVLPVGDATVEEQRAGLAAGLDRGLRELRFLGLVG